MACRRSPIALLCALIALLAVPGAASAAPLGGPATSCADLTTPSVDPDTTPPVDDTPLPLAGWYTAPYSVTLAAHDDASGVDRFEWRVDGGSYTTAAIGDTITLPDAGTHTLETCVFDVAGNYAERSVEVKIDDNRPTDLTDAGTVAWRRTPANVTVTAIDATSGVDHIEWQLDGGVIHSDPNDTSVSIAGDGAHTLRTWAVDVAGNRSLARDHAINIDTVVPSDETAAPGGWQTTAANVTVTGADALSGIGRVTYKIDDGAETTVNAASAVATISADGNHVLSTKVMDQAGNESGWKATPVNIDKTAPTNQTPVADSGWRGADYAVVVSGADGGSGLHHVEWKVDGGPVTSGGPTVQATVAGNGTHTLSTRVVDVAGNASAWRDDTVNIDKVAPVNTSTPQPGSSVGNNYVVTVSGTDAHLDRVEWQLDGGAVQSGPSGSTVTISGNGTHTLKTRVLDLAGNSSTWRTDTITVDAVTGDSTPPTDTTTTAPADWQTTPIPVTVSATDSGSGVVELQWRLDGQLHSSLVDDPSFTIAGNGDHLLETRARDAAGRISGWREQSFKIDDTTPVDATVIPSGWSNSRTITLAGSDDVSGVQEIEYRVGTSGPYLAGTAGQTIDLGGDGTFTVSHRAIDRAGNATARLTSTVMVDTTVPVNTSAVPASSWSTEPVEVALSGTDAHFDKVQWRIGTGGSIHDGGPAVIDGDGEHVLQTRAVDLAGNTSAWRSDTVRVDTLAPVNETAAAPAGWRSTAYSVQIEGSDAGAGVDVIEVKLDGGAVSNDPAVTVSGDGVHTIESRILDLAGRASVWRTDTIRIDSAAPTATLSCTSGWTRTASCTPTANGGPAGLATLTLARNSGTAEAVASGHAVAIAVGGVHTLTLTAVDGAGNQKVVQAQVKVDRTAPSVALACAAASTPTGYVCRASATDALSGLGRLIYSVNGGAWTAVPAGGSFTVAQGTVRVRAVDAVGNQGLTARTLAARKPPVVAPTVRPRTGSAPVYLAGRHTVDGMVGALAAARGADGQVSVEVGPLALARGRYLVEIVVRSGRARRTVTKIAAVGRRGGALRRITARLTGATGKTTVRLTVRKKHGRTWRTHVTGTVVLPK